MVRCKFAGHNRRLTLERALWAGVVVEVPDEHTPIGRVRVGGVFVVRTSKQLLELWGGRSRGEEWGKEDEVVMVE